MHSVTRAAVMASVPGDETSVAAAVRRQTLTTLGPDRLLFGTDSSFFPRGWHQPVYVAQLAILDDLEIDAAARTQILKSNFDRVFGNP